MLILGIESSCDETAASVVRDGREVLTNIVSSQIDIHTLYGGVVPEIASRAHVEAVSNVTRQALEGIGLENIGAIAVTNAPGLIGALLVGLNFAKSLAYATGKPLIPVHHIRGHVAANYISHPDLTPPFIALIASGGHSHIVRVEDYTRYSILGHTRDDAAGESFDKVARILGLGYPGGPKIDKVARNGDPHAIHFPQTNFKDAPFDFSFSGVKTAVINYVHNASQQGKTLTEKEIADVAASFQHAACTVLTEKAVAAVLGEGGERKLVLAGGVAANSTLRKYLEKESARHGIQLYMAPTEYCGDNAAMIASQGYYEYLAGHTAGTDLNAYATESIDF